MERKTPLYDCHCALDGKIVPFAGYLLPVQYPTGVIAEHLAVRTKACLFDVSHMGEVFYTGPDALENLNTLLTNDFTNMYDGQVRYSLMCNEEGGVVDDLIVYRFHQEKYMVVVNAANRFKDVEWMRSHVFGDVVLEDRSDEIAQLALQGPMAKEILSKLVDVNQLPERYYSFVPSIHINDIDCIVSQTGYTGEQGYEIYCLNDEVPILFQKLLEVGKEFGLTPCGLGARDTLRLEASMPLYGHELSDTITPFEAGLQFAVKLNKDHFIGKEALNQSLPLTRKRVGLKITGRGIVREQCTVFNSEGIEIGITTSGTFCPYLDGAYAMALLDITNTELHTNVEVEVRGRRITASVIELPFYKRTT